MDYNYNYNINQHLHFLAEKRELNHRELRIENIEMYICRYSFNRSNLVLIENLKKTGSNSERARMIIIAF